MENRKIIQRTYYEIGITLISPLNVGIGRSESIKTDADLIRNGEGELFVPGTALAGAFRNYLGTKKDEDSIYGFSKDEDGRMSSLYISDLCFEYEEKNVSARDRVRLNEDKIVDKQGKFDLEILEPGVSGVIRIEAVEREDDNYDCEDIIADIILAIEDGEIRLGANKNRGMGKLKVNSVGSKSFNAENIDEWIEFLSGDPENKIEHKDFRDWQRLKAKKSLKQKYRKYCVRLKLVNGISIRQYSAKPGEPDYENIKSNGETVIPGTSWNGAIRADAKDILCKLGMDTEKAELQIEEWFGRKKSKDKEGIQSKIVISESIVNTDAELESTRNRIDRFTGGTMGTALYTERVSFGGNTELEYMIRNDDDTKALCELMELVVADIKAGIVAVGGLTSIGRGVFFGRDENEEDVYKRKIELTELYKVVKGGSVGVDK